MILFVQQSAAIQKEHLDSGYPLLPIATDTICLKTNPDKSPYHLLPHLSSSLQDQYYLLTRRSQNIVLGHYSWLQPANNQSRVSLPFIDQKGWQLQGTFKIKQGSYYTFDAKIQLSPPNNPTSFFLVSQKQRLKENTVYYLDNENLGILIKIHQIT